MTISEVLTKHTKKWMKVHGVIGTGEGKSEQEPCIVILVKHRSEEIEKAIPKSVDGYKVVIEQVGDIEAIDSAK